jgi:hypothetical protein
LPSQVQPGAQSSVVAHSLWQLPPLHW